MWKNTCSDEIQERKNDEVDWGALAQAWIKNKCDENKFSNVPNFQTHCPWNQSNATYSTFSENCSVAAAQNNHWFSSSLCYPQPAALAFSPPLPLLPPQPPIPNTDNSNSVTNKEEVYSKVQQEQDVLKKNQTAMHKGFTKFTNLITMPRNPNPSPLDENECTKNISAWSPNCSTQKPGSQQIYPAKQTSRKILPAWIRDGLEKIGKNNIQKQPTKFTTDETKSDCRPYENWQKGDNGDSESDAELPTEEETKLHHQQETRYEEEDLMEKVKSYLTTILLEVTDSEIACISAEVYHHCSKAPAKPLVQSSALSSICNTGLVAGYSSDEESVASDDQHFFIDQEALNEKIIFFRDQQKGRLGSIEAETKMKACRSRNVSSESDVEVESKSRQHQRTDSDNKLFNLDHGTSFQISSSKEVLKNPEESALQGNKTTFKSDDILSTSTSKRKRKHSKKSHKHSSKKTKSRS